MKKTISIIICLSLIAASVIVFAACGKKPAGGEGPAKEPTGVTNADEGEKIVGGWTNAKSPLITYDFLKVFKKAAEITGVTYEPVAYLASQVVAGTNHCVLCKATPVVPDAKTTYAIVYIYEDLEGNAKITDVVHSDAEALFTDGDGGWTETDTPELTGESIVLLKKACETLTGAEYHPLALLAVRHENGTDFRIACRANPSIQSGDSWYVIVTVHADGNGNAEMTDTVEIR